MPRTSGILDTLSGGVSTRPHSQRAPGEADEQVNAYSLYKRSLSRRPPLEHVAKLLTDTTGWEAAFAHEIRRSDAERYIVLIINGTLHVFNETTGAEVTVLTPSGTSYLLGASSGYRAVTVGDQTVLCNRSIVTKKGTTISAAASRNALLVIRQGDYSTNYTITLNGAQVQYTTPSSGRSTIATDVIAGQLVTTLRANAFINSMFTFTQYGSTILVVPKGADDYTLSAADGLGDNAILAIKGSVQRFTDLPVNAPDGMIVQVQGDPTLTQGSYYMKYTAATTPTTNGVWQECVKPGALTSLDGSTLPWHLAYNGTLLSQTTAQGSPSLPIWDNDPFNPPNGLVVTFPTPLYPAGATVNLLIDGTPFSYLVPDGGATADAVAGAMCALVTANPTYAGGHTSGLPSFGFNRIDTNPIALSASITYDLSENFFNTALAMTVGQHVGRVIKNLTDGSSATIVSNGTKSIVSTALSGGATNKFNAGDVCAIYATGTYFVFEPTPWDLRGAGDDTSSPFPSFIGNAISDVFMHQGRLGLLSNASVVLSRAGDIFNLFRQSAYQLLPDDPIDVESSILSAPNFHSSANWNDALYIFSDLGPFKLSGNPVISPTTVTLTLTSEYKSDPQVHPLVLGNSLFFSALRSGVPILWEMRVRGVELARLAIAEEVTKPIEGYLEGDAVQMSADDTQGVLVYRTTQRNSLFVYVCQYDGMTKIQSSWSRWELAGNSQAVWAIARRGEVLLITQQSDGLYLNSLILDTSENPAARLTPHTAWWWGDGTMVFDGSKAFF